MSVRTSTVAFPEKTAVHYSNLLMYMLKCLFDDLRLNNVEQAWETLKGVASLVPEAIGEKIWRKIERIEEEAMKEAGKVRGVDAFSTTKKREQVYRNILGRHVYELVREVRSGLERMGLLYERYTVEEEE